MKSNQHLIVSSLICIALVACGSESQNSNSAPATPAVDAAKPAPSVQQISAEAKRCIELVKAERYAEAIAPCEQALEDTAQADVQKAYDEAKAEVQKAAQAAGAKALSDSLSGKPVDQSASDAAKGALGGGGEATK